MQGKSGKIIISKVAEIIIVCSSGFEAIVRKIRNGSCKQSYIENRDSMPVAFPCQLNILKANLAEA